VITRVRGNVILEIGGDSAISILLSAEIGKGDVYAKVEADGVVVGVYKVLAGDPGRASLALDCVHDLAEGMNISFGVLEGEGIVGRDEIALQCLGIPSGERYEGVKAQEVEVPTQDGLLAGSETGIVTRNIMGNTSISTIPGVKCIIKSK
jgi:hypothetical protein